MKRDYWFKKVSKYLMLAKVICKCRSLNPKRACVQEEILFGGQWKLERWVNRKLLEFTILELNRHEKTNQAPK